MCARRLHAWSGMWKWLQALWHDWWLVLRASQRDRTQVLREAWVAFQEGDSHDSRVLLDWLVRSSRNTDELAQLLDIRSTVREHQNDLVGAIDDAEGALPVGETSPAPRLDTYRIERLKWKEAVGRAGGEVNLMLSELRRERELAHAERDRVDDETDDSALR